MANDPALTIRLQIQETLETVFEMSQILNTGLTREQLAILVELCELGANPEALAAVVSEMRREAEALAQDSVGASSRV